MRRIVASIDVGTSSVKIIVGEIIKQNLNLLAVSDTPSKGIKKGLITDPVLARDSIKNGLKKIEELIGLKLSKAIVSVSSYNCEFAISEGTTTITHPDKLITGADIIMAMQGSVYNKIAADMELVNVTPTVFKINNDTIVKNPKGMIADKLTVKSVICMAPKTNIYPLLKILETLNIKVIDIALSSQGDYALHKNKETDELIGAIINLGDETTTVSIFNRGVLTNTEVIDLGGSNVDNDIAFIYKLTKADAINLKENLALCHKRLANAGEYETITNKLGETIKINQYEISEIVMCRILEILTLAKKQINLLTKKEISYIIVTGGLTEAKDFPLALEEVYGHNAAIGINNHIGARDNKFSSSIGLIKYFNSRLLLKDKEFSIFTIPELEELISTEKRFNVNENTLLGKIFGYFFDN